MKKKIQSALPAGRKLNLNKRTISNLDIPDMIEIVAGDRTNGNNCFPTVRGGSCNTHCGHGGTCFCS